MGYPIQLAHLEGKRALIAGGGAIAAQKIEPILASGARVHVVAPEITDVMSRYLPRVERFDRRAVLDDDIDGCTLVIAATDDRATNRRIAALARTRGILVNAVDDPDACSFFVPATIRRGPVTISVATDGASPLFAAQLRRVLEAALPRSVEDIADLFVRLRQRGLKGLAARSKLLRALADPTVGRLVDQGATDRAADRLETIANEKDEPFEPGTVAIVGAGPGSKSLLTLRALDRIQRADVILHDALVEPEVLALALPGTRIVNVGRRAEFANEAGGERRREAGLSTDASRSSGSESSRTSQAVTTALLIREAKDRHRVVRLHAGDPFVFGRGGEEGAALDEAGVPWEVVPGVSAVLAAPAAAKVPLTMRGEARGFTVRTGHTMHGYTRGELPKEEETIVVLMGLGGAREIMAGLIEEGYAQDTPVAAVSCASRANQRVVRATIATIADRLEHERVEAPATLLIGKIVRRAQDSATEQGSSSTAEFAA